MKFEEFGILLNWEGPPPSRHTWYYVTFEEPPIYLYSHLYFLTGGGAAAAGGLVWVSATADPRDVWKARHTDTETEQQTGQVDQEA